MQPVKPLQTTVAKKRQQLQQAQSPTTLADRKKLVLQYLRRNKTKPTSRNILAQKLGITTEQARYAIQALIADGKIHFAKKAANGAYYHVVPAKAAK